MGTMTLLPNSRNLPNQLEINDQEAIVCLSITEHF